MRRFFYQIQKKIIERDLAFSKDIKTFREVGGFYSISKNGKKLELKSILETVGDEPRVYVRPQTIGVAYDSNRPMVRHLNLSWDNINFLIGYHTHPHDNAPSSNDVGTYVLNRTDIPEHVTYFEGIYYGGSYPKFLWMIISRNL